MSAITTATIAVMLPIRKKVMYEQSKEHPGFGIKPCIEPEKFLSYMFALRDVHNITPNGNEWPLLLSTNTAFKENNYNDVPPYEFFCTVNKILICSDIPFVVFPTSLVTSSHDICCMQSSLFLALSAGTITDAEAYVSIEHATSASFVKELIYANQTFEEK